MSRRSSRELARQGGGGGGRVDESGVEAASGTPVTAHLGIVLAACLALLLAPLAVDSPQHPVLAAISQADKPPAPLLVVNKATPLPDGYEPPALQGTSGVLLTPEAADALTQLIQEASTAGVTITTVSGYRSFDDQAGLYARYVASYGQSAADEISARAGYSEHQTGLAVDIGNPDNSCALQACFAGTPAGRWVADNAHHHGFIVRYQEGETEVTGYSNEPWHLRYVGVEVATAIHERNSTLEEYLGLPAAPGYR